MSQPSENPSARSGRLLLGSLAATLCFLGISETENIHLTANNNGLKSNIVELGKKLDAETELATRLGSQLNDANKENVALNSTLGERNATITKNVKQIQDLTRELKDTGDRLTKTEADLMAGLGREKNLNEQLTLAGRRETALKAEIAAAGKREESLKSTVVSLEKAQVDLNAAFETRGKQLADGENRETALKGNVGTLEKEKADLNVAITARSAEIAELKKGLDELNKVYAAQQEMNNSLAKEKTDLMSSREAMQKQINDLNERLKSLSGQNEQQKGAMEQLKEEKSALIAEQKKLTSLADNLTNQQKSAMTEREQLSGACTELVTRLENLTSKVESLEKEFVVFRNPGAAVPQP